MVISERETERQRDREPKIDGRGRETERPSGYRW